VHNIRAPEGLAGLPTPDRVLVRGGGTDVLDACLGRLAGGGRLVRTTTSLAGAIVAAERLGALVQVSVAGGEWRDGEWRLVGDDPVFVAWGP